MQRVIKKQDWEVHWDYCKQFIEPALKHQDAYTIDDVEDKIRHGFFHLWPGKESAFITEIVTYPQHKSNEFIILWWQIRRTRSYVSFY